MEKNVIIFTTFNYFGRYALEFKVIDSVSLTQLNWHMNFVKILKIAESYVMTFDRMLYAQHDFMAIDVSTFVFIVRRLS